MAPKASKKAKPKAKKAVRDLPLKADKAKHVKGGVTAPSPWHIQKW
jgi:hypothetical protein